MLQPDWISAVNAGIDWPKPATTASSTTASSTIPLDLQLCKGMCQQLMLAADFAAIIPHSPCTRLFSRIDEGGENKTVQSCVHSSRPLVNGLSEPLTNQQLAKI
jgi:hypothetical protein